MTASRSMEDIHSFTSEAAAVHVMPSQRALFSQGAELQCWGCGDLGQTGRGGAGDVAPHRAMLEAFTPGKLGRVKLMACGSSHSIVVTGFSSYALPGPQDR
ncbi:hypothetical protein AAFF_G00024510 [Aldrovandia affinis]|uniref:Uncharacterized protein n=1 Tax=Aldrovandia affinis TaxID=143900 RepID=A0AAD7WZS2_9TELE|nr:hypothetical protein AAFF_G00024510 [Aldrovandia affinis]